MKVFFAILLAVLFVATIATEEPKRLIKFSESDNGIWMTQSEIEKLSNIKTKGQELNFMDITETQHLQDGEVPAVSPIVSELRMQKDVHAAIAQVSEANMNATINKLSQYFNRFYTTDTAVQAAHWLRDQYTDIISKIANADRRRRFSVELFAHTFKQPSVIVKMTGKSPTVGSEIVVIGGHIDSTAGGAGQRSPGADDDASGTSCVLESFRVLANDAAFNPDRAVEWHGYAAEEAGLLGSQAIAQKYKADGKRVHSMLQNDMTGFNSAANADKVGIITDFVDPALTAQLRKLVVEYGKLPFGDTRCGYACSDHASFTRAGYRSAFHFEVHQFSMLNRNIHTANDVIAHLDMKRATGFTRTAIGFAYENGKQ
jgi:leucyl aminopeptidase